MVNQLVITTLAHNSVLVNETNDEIGDNIDPTLGCGIAEYSAVLTAGHWHF